MRLGQGWDRVTLSAGANGEEPLSASDPGTAKRDGGAGCRAGGYPMAEGKVRYGSHRGDEHVNRGLRLTGWTVFERSINKLEALLPTRPPTMSDQPEEAQ